MSGLQEKTAADLVSVRPILDRLIRQNNITEDEKQAVLDFLGASDKLSYQILREASKLADRDKVLFKALTELERSGTYKPEPLVPRIPVTEKAPLARSESSDDLRSKNLDVPTDTLVTQELKKLYGEI